MAEPITVTADQLYTLIEGDPAAAVAFLADVAAAMTMAHSEHVAVFTGWTPSTVEHDGGQILAAVQEDGSVHVALRTKPNDTWGPPLRTVQGVPAMSWAASMVDTTEPVIDVGRQTALGGGLPL